VVKISRKNIGATLSLKDNGFTTGIRNAITGTNNLRNSTTNATGSLKKMGSQSGITGNSIASLTKKAVGLVAAYAGFSAIKDFLMSSVTAANESANANARLDQLMGNVKGTTLAQIDAVKSYVSELQKLTVVEDDVAIAGASQLATFALNGKNIKKLLPAMNDLAVGTYGVNVTQEQVIGSANLMGKVMQGQVGALSRVGVTFDKTQESILKNGTEAQKTTTLIQVLKQNYGGLAEKMAQTPEGRIIQLKNAWGDVQETIGGELYPVITMVLGFMASKIPVVSSAIAGAVTTIKPPLLWIKDNIIPPLINAFMNVRDWGVSAFNNIKSAIEANRPKFESIKAVFIDIGLKLKSAFDNAQPSINWVKDVGLPALVGILADVTQKITDIYNYFNDNWSQIKPIVEGVTNAIIIYNGALLISTGWTKAVTAATWGYTAAVNLWKAAQTGALGIELAWVIWRGKDIIQTAILIGMYTWDAIVKGAHAVVTWVQVAATGALTGAQWLLNAAFLASPIGWIVLGVGALIAVFTLLWKNNEGFRNFFIGMWEGIKSAVVSAGGIIKGVINGICSAINILIKGYVGGINGLINGVNGVSGALGIPAIPNLPVPQIPMLASGGLIQRAGSVMVGERGAEILSLPRGASVTPLDKAGNKTENHINININGSNLTVDAIVGELVPRLKLALANM